MPIMADIHKGTTLLWTYAYIVIQNICSEQESTTVMWSQQSLTMQCLGEDESFPTMRKYLVLLATLFNSIKMYMMFYKRNYKFIRFYLKLFCILDY